jgi:hypothetical protein
MRFESHLGHDVFPRQGRFCFDVCTKLAIALPDGLDRGLWPGRRGAYSGVWVAGSGPWLVGPPPALNWDYPLPPSCAVGLGLGVQHLSMVRFCGSGMTYRTRLWS